MIRFVLPLAASVLFALPAAAATYSAHPATPVATQRIIARDISWACGPDACQGATDESRPLVLCQGLAARAGHLDSFLVDGRALVPAQLDRCNAAAPAAARTLAATN